MSEIVLSTRRLALRPVSPADGIALFPLIDTWAVAQWLGVVPWPDTMADMEYFLREVAEPRRQSLFPIFAICVDGAPIGCMEWRGHGSEGLKATHEMAELGYWLGEPYWGKGYATEAVSRLVSYAFETSGVTSIISGVFEGNVASLRVQEKLGFEVAGTVMRMCRPRNKELPLIATRLSRERFRPVS